LKELAMGHAVRIQSDEQYIAALRVLNNVSGTWRGVGPSSDPVLLLTDDQYNALVEAGVVSTNGKKVKPCGKKGPAKRPTS
jgi:hypothetical protein